MQHSAEGFHGLKVSTLHCVVSSLYQHALLCQAMVSHIVCCVLRTMGIHRVQSSIWRLYDIRGATRGMFGSEKHYPVLQFVRELVRDALFRIRDKVTGLDASTKTCRRQTNDDISIVGLMTPA